MRHKVQSYLTESEIKDLLRQPNRASLQGKRDFAILLLMLETGIRRNELCNLRRGDLKVEGKKIWLYVWGKGSRQRKIPIKDLELIEALQSYWAKAKITEDPNEPMFKTLGKKGPGDVRPITWKTVRWLVEKYAKLAKIPKNIHPHSLRHTFITHTLRKSGDLAAVQALAGHSSIASTQAYLHTEEDRMERAIKKLTLK
jgi:site-specific recombinase XerD